MSPETAIAWGEWRVLARDLRLLVAGLRAGSIDFTPKRAKLLEESVSVLSATGEVVMKELAQEAGSVASAKSHAPAPVPEVRPEPRMIHDLEGIYLPEANRGWLKDMARPAGRQPARAKRVGRFTLIEGGRS